MVKIIELKTTQSSAIKILVDTLNSLLTDVNITFYPQQDDDTHYELLSGLNEGEEIVTGSYKAISKDLSHNKIVTMGKDSDNN